MERKMTDLQNPSHYVTEYGDAYDCTGHIGAHRSDAPWAMYSFESPAYALWNAMAAQLHKKGWTDEEIKEFLQSKQTRWMMDGDLSDALEKLGRKYAKNAVKPKDFNKFF